MILENELVVKNYPKQYTDLNGIVHTILNEECTCGRMITEHAGIGHGPSLDGKCPKFTWIRFIEIIHMEEEE
tara:strand:- start:4493 stop:4708 length:216 start_codon:yes stop_codon:yes gene_type:complete